jgi:DivIVA domain-containing protein
VPLTPADIHNVAFAKAAIGKRGYDEEQVDALLDEVSLEMVKLLEEKADLHDRAVARPAPAAASDDAAGELGRLTAELRRAREACDRAEWRAGELRRELDQARSAARPVAPIVPPESVGRVLAMAEHTAEQHLDDARRESEELLADARERSGRMVLEARQEAGDIERDAHRRDVEAAGELETRQAGALREIREMTTFAEGYYAALRDHIIHQSEHLGDPAGS